jgi:ABC-2 type transport system ATP-binding protein
VQTPPLSERALPLLTITGLRRSFGEVDVLSGVDAEVRPGEAVAVTGPNGSGKSTLLRCVAGMDRPSAGSILLCGRPMREHHPQTRRSVAAVLDDVEFFADLAVAEHLALLMSAHGDAAPDEHTASLLDEAGLADAADQLPAGLSSGQRRRLALATCFARPRLLVLLDEPEQRLDSAGRRWLTQQ